METVRMKPGPWRWLMNKAPDISASEHHVALTLAVHFNNKGEIASKYKVGQRKLAKECRMRRTTCRESLQSLEAKGYLEIETGSGTIPDTYAATCPAALVGSGAVPLDQTLVGSRIPLVGSQSTPSGTAREPESPISPRDHQAQKFSTEEEKDHFFEVWNQGA